MPYLVLIYLTIGTLNFNTLAEWPTILQILIFPNLVKILWIEIWNFTSVLGILFGVKN
jgi:hypothetical protein